MLNWWRHRYESSTLTSEKQNSDPAVIIQGKRTNTICIISSESPIWEKVRNKQEFEYSNGILNQDNVSIYLKFKVNTIYVMRHKMCSKAQTKGAQIQINQWGREGTGGRSAEWNYGKFIKYEKSICTTHVVDHELSSPVSHWHIDVIW